MPSTPGCADPPWLRQDVDSLTMDGLPLKELAHRWGTPLYVYSAETLRTTVARLHAAFQGLPVRFFYAIKANANAAILRLLRGSGLGAEVVSEGELWRALYAGFAPTEILFTGTGKKENELRSAVEQGVHALVVECLEELKILGDLGRPVRFALRLNLGLEVPTHPGLTTSAPGTKFGLDEDSLQKALRLLHGATGLRLVGLHTHLGSNISDPVPYLTAARRLFSLARELLSLGFPLEFVDLGGGFSSDFPFSQLAEAFRAQTGEDLKVYFEPGRAIVARAGCLVTQVLYVKTVHGRRFVVVDAAMNDLLRPALYGASHPVRLDPLRPGPLMEATVVGPVCETTDTFGIYSLPPVEPGDLLVFLDTGAYGFAMASQYNSRPRPAEILVFQGQAWLVRAREDFADLVRGEVLLECLRGDG